MEPYTAAKAKLITREMTELLVLDLVKKRLVTKKIELTIGYDRTSVTLSYQGKAPKENQYKYTTTLCKLFAISIVFPWISLTSR